MDASAVVVKTDVPVIQNLRGFYGGAWQHASKAHDHAIEVVVLLQQIHSPPSDLLTLAKIAEDSTKLLRVALERARTRAAVSTEVGT